MKTARQTAVQALSKVHGDGGYSNLVLDNAIVEAGLSPRDASFATALFYGVLERGITLDHCLSRYSKRPLGKLDRQVLEILRISLYQMLYMTSVPDSAAVSEGVSLAKTLGKTSAGGFINGVLRSFLRDGKTVIKLEEGATWEQEMSISCSCPLWLVEELLNAYGKEDTAGILLSSLGKPPLYLRVNTTRTTASALAKSLVEQGISVNQSTGLENCLEVGETGDLSELPAYTQGLFHVQDKASQLCALALDPRPGQRVLDVCAAPGGKTLTIAQLMENRGEVLAGDLHESRVGLIASAARRLGLTCVKAIQNDASNLDVRLGLFDRVLCDVPCSGLGIIRRKPEIKYKDPSEFLNLPIYQYKILRISANYVDEGGLLLYSTCTLRPAENEEIVEKFLQNHPDFEPAPLPEIFEAGGGHTKTLLPHKGGTDGFFISTVRRKQ